MKIFRDSRQSAEVALQIYTDLQSCRRQTCKIGGAEIAAKVQRWRRKDKGKRAEVVANAELAGQIMMQTNIDSKMEIWWGRDELKQVLLAGYKLRCRER